MSVYQQFINDEFKPKIKVIEQELARRERAFRETYWFNGVYSHKELGRYESGQSELALKRLREIANGDDAEFRKLKSDASAWSYAGESLMQPWNYGWSPKRREPYFSHGNGQFNIYLPDNPDTSLPYLDGADSRIGSLDNLSNWIERTKVWLARESEIVYKECSISELSAKRIAELHGRPDYKPFTVYKDIAYGLKIQKKDKTFIKNRVEELLELVGLPGVEKRYPDQLSGGQRQRIALARALAPSPELLLLDEPFAAIDAKVRKELRTWLRETIDKIGITSIFVTHDQDEAIEVTDEIVITNNGRVEQVGSPSEIYLNPATPFVARFIGQSDVIEHYSKLKGFEHVKGKHNAVVRPEFVEIHKFTDNKQHDFESTMEDGIVTGIYFRGSAYEVHVDIGGGTNIVGRIPLTGTKIIKGDSVKVLIKQIYAFDDTGTEILTNKGLYNEELYYI